MLNVFPIQFLAPIAYLILRITIGTLLIRLGFSHMRNRDTLTEVFTFSFFPYTGFTVWYLALIEIIVGALFFIGLYTQIAALLSMVYALKFIVLHKKLTHPLIPERTFFILLFVISLSLFITGAGPLAFDIPI
jgi:uncharacterized membrane protein YphA (DoxX/SURF4 family)